MISLITTDKIKPTNWSGGLTSELFIFPLNSNYKELNFEFRLSTATIEVDTSIFTKLPNVKRTLMVLDGTLELHHKDEHSTILNQFEKDQFMGDWETISYGQVVDFNLMINHPELNGNMSQLIIGKKKSLDLSCEKHAFIYVYKGSIQINEQELQSNEGVYFDSSEQISIFANTNTTLIYVSIS